MTIRNLKEAEAALLPYVPLVKQFTGQNITLKRIRPLMKLLGNPQDQLKIIHIAGTSGKTSTAYYMSALIFASGQRVGLTISPHVDKITERIQVNGRPISDEEFCEQLSKFLEIVQRSNLQPTYFELVYAFAIWVLNKHKVDYAVVETGLGGLHDATNVAERSDKICILTDIGFDHTEILGKTLAEIATQKVGIVHEENQVFIYRQAVEVMKVVEHWLSEHQATLHIVKENSNPENANSKMPAYQLRNWNLAFNTYQYLVDRDKLQHLTRQALAKTQSITIPGRMEIKQLENKTLLMDGAHNFQKMSAFIVSFNKLYPNSIPTILLALKKDKDLRKLLPLIISFADKIIVTKFKTTQDLPVESMDPKILANALHKAGAKNVVNIPEHDIALEVLLKSPTSVVVITGSFYLLSQIRSNKIFKNDKL
ncbi:MAG TPA: Mur ligase family protein [Candidatus Saccharimonadales bacterium]|nr:Mur ligase family protein [Candidatus Saccharimonadales bacterium]